ncbi:MAG TPA: terminase small subunit [Flavipsychrobacter sp.]|nr:terminase small subunit [Flavipsychrobacter sp.]
MNLRHETFIQEMIAHGNRREAYLKAYPQSSPAAAYNNACRLLSVPYIRNKIQEAYTATENLVLQQLQQDYGAELADVYEKRVLLAHIIKTALQQNETSVTDTETKTVTTATKRNSLVTASQQPTISQVLRAIVLDTKLEYGWKRKL